MRNFMWTVIAGLLIFGLSLQAQDCTFYFPTKKGTSLELKTYNAKDKVTGTSKSNIVESTATSVKFNTEVLDSKGNSVSKGDYEVKCAGGEFVVDMKSYLQNVDMSKYKGMEMTVDARNMSIPSKLQAGQRLNDGEVDLKFQFMTISVKIYNRIVAGFEDITTPAGKFKCAKITANIDSKTVLTMKSKSVEWISEKVGVVRSENYNTSDKLLGYTVLTAITQ